MPARGRTRGGSRAIQPTLARGVPPAAAVLLFAWFAFLVSRGQAGLHADVFAAALKEHVLVLLLVIVYATYLTARRRLPGPTRLDFAAAGAIAAYALAVGASIYPRLSLEAALLPATALLTFYAFHDFRFLSNAAIVRGLAATGAVLALLALERLASHYLDWLALVQQVQGSTGLADLLPPAVPRIPDDGVLVNVLAMALNLLWPFALLLILQARKRPERFGALVALVLMLVALFFTLSRAAWVGTAAALFLFALLYLLRGRGFSLPALGGSFSSVRLGMLAAVALGSIVVGVVLIAGWDTRPEWLFRPSLSPRYDALSVGARIFREEPFLGAGPATYPLLYDAYSGEFPVQNIHPHNGYLHLLVETGLVGGIVFLYGGLVLAYALLAAFQRAKPFERPVLAACLASLASLTIHALADSPNPWSTALLPLAAVLALSMRLCPPSAGRRWLPGLGARCVPLLLLPLLLAGWPLIDRAHADYEASLNSLAGGRFAEAAARAARAAERDPANAAYQLHAGVLQAILYVLESESGALPSALRLERSRGFLHAALQREPRSALAYANLALVESMLAEREGRLPTTQALEAARSVLALAPHDPVLAAVAGYVFEQAELEPEAAYAFGLAMAGDVSLLQSPFWALTPSRSALRRDAIESANLDPCEAGRVTAVYRGFRDDLERLAARCLNRLQEQPGDSVARSNLAVILHALGRDAEALFQAEEAARRVPDNPSVRGALAIVRCAGGDVSAVRRELARASFLGDADSTLLLAYTYEPPPPGNPLPANLRLPLAPAPLPAAVLERLRRQLATAAPMVFDGGTQHYLLGVLYYRVRFQRESPASLLVPDEWLALASPRALLMLQALRGR